MEKRDNRDWVWLTYMTSSFCHYRSAFGSLVLNETTVEHKWQVGTNTPHHPRPETHAPYSTESFQTKENNNNNNRVQSWNLGHVSQANQCITWCCGLPEHLNAPHAHTQLVSIIQKLKVTRPWTHHFWSQDEAFRGPHVTFHLVHAVTTGVGRRISHYVLS